jgi:hypothetical protein
MAAGHGTEELFGDVRPARLADFHEQQLVVVVDEIVGQPAAHFAAGTKDSYG